MSTYLDFDFDRYSNEFSTFEDLTKGWIPIRIFPSEHYRTLSSMLDTEVDKMFKWCNDNCENRWTAIWKFQNYYIYFESNDDMAHFYLTWTDMIDSPIF